ncbi:PDZ domain-containing protein [Gordonia sp. TBRC 11910]|uniref:PDZ domain-containing protein n=1 Tax=Gordonia asplenii TaxID=2725283 RepID=A0A848KYQ0_9ACTN|nr:trypsin-like peptidase domain-containing protein [Gordonia asplenii]NMO00558.1 PDZ domain-containing protein [Gordonia asplenii]
MTGDDRDNGDQTPNPFGSGGEQPSENPGSGQPTFDQSGHGGAHRSSGEQPTSSAGDQLGSGTSPFSSPQPTQPGYSDQQFGSGQFGSGQFPAQPGSGQFGAQPSGFGQPGDPASNPVQSGAGFGHPPTTPGNFAYGQGDYPPGTYGQGAYGQGGFGQGDPAQQYGAAPQFQQAPAAPKRRGAGTKAAIGVGVVALALVAGGAGAATYSALDNDTATTAITGPLGGDPNESNTPVEAPAGSVQAVAASVLPTVVSIIVQEGNAEGEGSGVVLKSDGTIMTNNHVVSVGGDRPASKVTVAFEDGSRASATVVGADAVSDIAVIKVNKSGLKPITIGTSKNLVVGQDVIAIGSPLGLAGTVTTGIISSLNRPVSTSRTGSTTSVIDAIQTDAAINPGNSGGALVNARGALIGVNTAIATTGGSDSSGSARSGSIGLGFAIPVDQAIAVANQLIESGKAQHSSLGVSVRDDSTDPLQAGAPVSDVTPNGPAARAGIPKGAIITKLGDRTIASGDALVAAVRSYQPGAVVPVTYTAGGQTKTVQVTLGTLPTS